MLAGDALLGVWPGTEATLPQRARDAVACALVAQQSLLGAEGAPEDPVWTHIGVACGGVEVLHLGGVCGRFNLVICGGAVREVTAAAQAAAPGQVAVSTALWKALQGRGRGTPAGEIVVVDRLQPSGRQLRPPARAEPGHLRTYISAAVLDRLDAGQAAWLAELRPISVLFVALPGVPGDDHAQGQALVCSLHEILYDLGGTLGQFPTALSRQDDRRRAGREHGGAPDPPARPDRQRHALGHPVGRRPLGRLGVVDPGPAGRPGGRAPPPGGAGRPFEGAPPPEYMALPAVPGATTMRLELLAAANWTPVRYD
jgi:hypothetical protein